MTIYWKKAVPAASKKNSTTSKSAPGKTKSKPTTSKSTTKSTPQVVRKPVLSNATPKPTRILPATLTPSPPRRPTCHNLRRSRRLHHARRRLLCRLPHVGRLPLWQWRPLDTSVAGDVTARRSKMHGEFESLKQRPMTSSVVSYRIELAVAKTLMPG